MSFKAPEDLSDTDLRQLAAYALGEIQRLREVVCMLAAITLEATDEFPVPPPDVRDDIIERLVDFMAEVADAQQLNRCMEREFNLEQHRKN